MFNSLKVYWYGMDGRVTVVNFRNKRYTNILEKQNASDFFKTHIHYSIVQNDKMLLILFDIFIIKYVYSDHHHSLLLLFLQCYLL